MLIRRTRTMIKKGKKYSTKEIIQNFIVNRQEIRKIHFTSYQERNKLRHAHKKVSKACYFVRPSTLHLGKENGEEVTKEEMQ